ncbi:hypothetical protein JAAARDRAFT_49805 [Jaapia argillacea MUCL 33604]|uniref:Uncharacterized protein n=1 Tax=Jaapia argillacea MUCL 33604 TaxID=933084 RepID=A0A067PPT3_9AGAM|nr:hypothetical protein JAAARDRAFT_49805 [Jaapia argillacea MUCL 33604]
MTTSELRPTLDETRDRLKGTQEVTGLGLSALLASTKLWRLELCSSQKLHRKPLHRSQVSTLHFNLTRGKLKGSELSTVVAAHAEQSNQFDPLKADLTATRTSLHSEVARSTSLENNLAKALEHAPVSEEQVDELHKEDADSLFEGDRYFSLRVSLLLTTPCLSAWPRIQSPEALGVTALTLHYGALKLAESLL